MTSIFARFAVGFDGQEDFDDFCADMLARGIEYELLSYGATRAEYKVEVDDHYDGRPVLGHKDRQELGAKVRYFYHIRPSGKCWMLGKIVYVGDYTVVLYRCRHKYSIKYDWECYGVATEQQATAMIKEDNVEYIHEEGEQ